MLVEGESDRRALRTLALRLGVAVPEVVVMNGITNLRAHLVGRTAVLLLHDLAETTYVDRVLADSPADVRRFVCDADLEDELIRAVGVEGMLAVVDAHGERAAYDLMAQQPAQRDRPDAERLRRWLGARSGHKISYAGYLAEAVPVGSVPAPLGDLLLSCGRWSRDGC